MDILVKGGALTVRVRDGVLVVEVADDAREVSAEVSLPAELAARLEWFLVEWLSSIRGEGHSIRGPDGAPPAPSPGGLASSEELAARPLGFGKPGEAQTCHEGLTERKLLAVACDGCGEVRGVSWEGARHVACQRVRSWGEDELARGWFRR